MSERIPQHRRLYEILRKHILQGLYPEGSLLPSENEMCSQYAVTRPTVRQALSRLVSDGFIKKHQGKGSIVQPLPRGIGILSIQGTTTGIGRHNLETVPAGKPVACPWPEDFPFELSEKEKESGCIRLERIRIVDGSPVLYEISYLPNINLPRFVRKSFVNRSLFEVLRSAYQIEVMGGYQRIRAQGSPAAISRHLRLPEGDAVLCLQRVIETNRVDFRFFSIIFCDTRKFYLEGSF